MEIREITYKRTINLGNYENESFEMLGVLKSNENPATAASALRRFVHTQLGLEEPEETAAQKKLKERPIKIQQPNEEKEVEAKVEKVEVTEEVKVENVEVKEIEKPKKKAVKKKAVKAKKPKTVAYDRGIKEHKDLVRSVLTSVCPDWRTDEDSKKIAITCSKELEGKPLMDENGMLLQSFSAEVEKYFDI